MTKKVIAIQPHTPAFPARQTKPIKLAEENNKTPLFYRLLKKVQRQGIARIEQWRVL